MEIGSIALYALQVLSLVDKLVAAGKDVHELIVRTSEVIRKAQDEGRRITNEEWNESTALMDNLRAQLHEGAPVSETVALGRKEAAEAAIQKAKEDLAKAEKEAELADAALATNSTNQL